jgi:nicotinamide riboside kinase
MNSLVVNLWGGPSAGKTSGAFYVMGELKLRGVSCEYAAEFAKEKHWEGTTAAFENELYIFAKQNYRLSKLNGKVKVIVTDAPLLASTAYAQEYSDNYKRFVYEEFNKYHNLNYYLERVFPYEQNGRNHDEKDAGKISDDIRMILSAYKVQCTYTTGNKDGYNLIISEVLQRI